MNDLANSTFLQYTYLHRIFNSEYQINEKYGNFHYKILTSNRKSTVSSLFWNSAGEIIMPSDI